LENGDYGSAVLGSFITQQWFYLDLNLSTYAEYVYEYFTYLLLSTGIYHIFWQKFLVRHHSGHT